LKLWLRPASTFETIYLMRLISSFVLGLLAFSSSLAAATPPAAQLLPADTLALVSVPDWDKATVYWNQSAQGKLWHEPALKAFREKLVQNWQEELTKFEHDFQVKLPDYFDLLHGQITVALTPRTNPEHPDSRMGVLVLMDTKDKPEALKVRLTEQKKKWVDQGKTVKTERIRDAEFTALIINSKEVSKTLEKVFPGAKDDDATDDSSPGSDVGKKPTTTEVLLGQSGPLLIASNNASDVETVLARLAGGMAPALAEQAVYEADYSRQFRDAPAFAWVNFASLFAGFQKQLNESLKGAQGNNALVPGQDKLLGATGLGAVKSIAASLTASNEGSAAEVFVSAREGSRQGLLKLFVPERKESGPPPFIGSDVVKFSRWRIDGQKTWAGLENILKGISTALAGTLQMSLEAAGKDQDPNFDLKKSLIGNLGDDFISVQKGPRSNQLGDLTSPPSLFLIGSANAEQFVQGLKVATTLMPLVAGDPNLKEREFLGRKIYSIALPSTPDPDADADAPKTATPQRSFHFAAAAGYAAMSSDVSILEEYLRANEGTAKPLRELPGLNEAAQKVGGMSTGSFGYENQVETVRVWLDSAKGENAAMEKLLSLGNRIISPEERKNMKSGLDVSLLPPLEKISKYFHFLVYALNSSSEGISWKVFLPTPPKLSAQK
jgi:hypothetical protein